jgi:hypothetical protein
LPSPSDASVPNFPAAWGRGFAGVVPVLAV